MKARKMKTRIAQPLRLLALGLLFAALGISAPAAWAQTGQGGSGGQPPAADGTAAPERGEQEGAESAEGSQDEFEQAFAGEGEEGSGEEGGPQLNFSAMLELEQGTHIGPAGVQNRTTVLGNRLLRLAGTLDTGRGTLLVKLDVLDDTVTRETTLRVREARVLFSPAEWVDVSVGRQVATWGVGDLLFINDLFPKNWQAIFLGRDPEFWKDSASALRLSIFMGDWTWDLVNHPEFAPDTTPIGCRFAVFDPNAQRLNARPELCGQSGAAFTPAGDLAEGETATRLKVQLGSHELAFYAYTGLFKSPRGLRWADAAGNPTGNQTPVPGPGDVLLVPYHPRLNVYGISEEGQVGAGVLSLEAGYYESKDDPAGDNPLIENSLWKLLAGYRLDWTANFAAGFQWFRESMRDFGAYRASLPPTQVTVPRARNRDTYTVRLTLKFQQDTLRINLFHYERPQDRDRFTKLDFSKRLTDHVVIAAGVNVFDGARGYEDREFGMLRDDDNAFFRVRFSI